MDIVSMIEEMNKSRPLGSKDKTQRKKNVNHGITFEHQDEKVKNHFNTLIQALGDADVKVKEKPTQSELVSHWFNLHQKVGPEVANSLYRKYHPDYQKSFDQYVVDQLSIKKADDRPWPGEGIKQPEYRPMEQASGKKKGEGSKGGKVIGHTKSGEPIYGKHVSYVSPKDPIVGAQKMAQKQKADAAMSIFQRSFDDFVVAELTKSHPKPLKAGGKIRQKMDEGTRKQINKQKKQYLKMLKE